MKPSAQLDQRSERTSDLNVTCGRPVHAGNDLQQRALTRSITPDEAQHLSLRDLERDVLDRIEIVVVGLVVEELGEQLAQGVRALLDDPETLSHILQPDWN